LSAAPIFLFFSAQRIEKAQFGQGNPRKSKPFCLDLLGFPCARLASRLFSGSRITGLR
jgi:hypothetical protein